MPIPDSNQFGATPIEHAGSGRMGSNRGLLVQGWIGIALWMAVGLVLEGLLGFKSPAYLLDPQRRELFRLAHSHGVLLSLLLIAAALCLRRGVPRAASLPLRIGAVLMPVGFLLSGVRHPEGDPGPAIWLVPPGALITIFGAVLTGLAVKTQWAMTEQDS